MNPLVSVIIPAYNAAHLLPDAIESALAQTYHPLEVIVVDDGSTDETPEVLARYGSRVTAFRQDNGGVAAARNRALEAAQGVYVACLDADDIWRPDKIEIQVGLMTDGVGLIGSSADETGESGRRTRAVSRAEILVNNPFSASSVLFRMACVRELGPFDPRRDFLGVEDWDLWLRIADRYRALYLFRNTVTIRAVAGSVSSIGNAEAMFRAEMAVLDKHAAGAGAGISDRLLWRRARAHRHFAAAWGAAMAGRRADSVTHLKAAFRLNPLQLCQRKPLALGWRVATGTFAVPARSTDPSPQEANGVKSSRSSSENP